ASTPNWPGCSSTSSPETGARARARAAAAPGRGRCRRLAASHPGNGKPRSWRGFLCKRACGRSGRHDVGRLRALRALHDVEADALAFLQRAESLGVDGGVVHDHIRAAILGSDETATLGVVEPLHGAETHKT